MALLADEDFQATMGTPMTLLQPGEDVEAVPQGDYFRSIPASDLKGHDFTTFEVERVYRDPTHP